MKFLLIVFLLFSQNAQAANGIKNRDIASNAAIAFSKMVNLTASRACEIDGSGDVSSSSVTSTELGYLSGVTSALQTQLDGKLSTAGNAATATALAANPTDCSANQFANASAANGDLTCAQPAFSNLSGSATVAQKTTATQALTTCTTSRAIDWSTGNDFTLTLTSANACTLSFSNAVSGQVITIELTNGSGDGDATVVWPSLRWAGGTAPTMTTGAAALDICTIKYNGSAYSGSCIQDMSTP